MISTSIEFERTARNLLMTRWRCRHIGSKHRFLLYSLENHWQSCTIVPASLFIRLNLKSPSRYKIGAQSRGHIGAGNPVGKLEHGREGYILEQAK